MYVACGLLKQQRVSLLLLLLTTKGRRSLRIGLSRIECIVIQLHLQQCQPVFAVSNASQDSTVNLTEPY